jgi:signal transduction histidine kinase
VLSVCAEASRALGFEPLVRFAGAIDSGVDDAVTDHLLAVLREALANVARHASASAAEVHVSLRDGELHLEVADDGVGIPPDLPAGGGHGLRSMRERATRLGGHVDVEPRPGGGTRVGWVVRAGVG